MVFLYQSAKKKKTFVCIFESAWTPKYVYKILLWNTVNAFKCLLQIY